MTKIVDLEKYKEDRTPHFQGTAKCTNCLHEWQAVAPEGTSGFECPSCGTDKGVWANHVGAMEGHEWFKCNCGSFFFNLLRSKEHGEYLLCCNCGKRTER